MSEKFSDQDYWKAIILYGLNTATYKLAFAHSLLDFSAQGKNAVDWSELADKFLNKYIARLSTQDPMPQLGLPGRLTVMERVVAKLKAGTISPSQGVEEVALAGLNDVVPRFQTINSDPKFIGARFFEIDHGRKIILTDHLHNLASSTTGELREEIDARWALLEGAFLIKNSNWSLSNDIRQTYIANGYDRRDLTPHVPFLRGYQGSTCFYCAQSMMEGGVHVDHVLPRQVVNHDEIWNLVLAHPICNELKSDFLVAPFFMEKLYARNENIVGSSHPWRKQIELQLGKSPPIRKSNLAREYERVGTILGRNYWGGSDSYNPSVDPFFERLITKLNE